jgi:hypothetical protein
MYLSITKNAKHLVSALKVVAALADDAVFRFGATSDECCLRIEVVSSDDSSYAQLWLHKSDVVGDVRPAAVPGSCRVNLKKVLLAAREVTTLSDVLVIQHDPQNNRVLVSARSKKTESAPIDVSSSRGGVELTDDLLAVPPDSDLDCVPFDAKELETVIKAVPAGERVSLPQWPEVGAAFKQETLLTVVRPTQFKKGMLMIPRTKPGNPIVISFSYMSASGLSRLRVHVAQLQP